MVEEMYTGMTGQLLEHIEEKELNIQDEASGADLFDSNSLELVDYFDLNPQVIQLIMLKQKSFITDALTYEGLYDHLAKIFPYFDFQPVDLAVHESEFSLNEIISSFVSGMVSYDSIQIFILENLKASHLPELEKTSNFFFIGFMDKSEFNKAWESIETMKISKLILYEFATGKSKNYKFGSLEIEHEITNNYIQNGAFAIADFFTEFAQTAKTIYEMYIEKGADTSDLMIEFYDSTNLEPMYLQALPTYIENIYQIKKGSFNFLLKQFQSKIATQKEELDGYQVPECKGIPISHSNIINESFPVSTNEFTTEGLISIWNEELGPLIIDQFPHDSDIDKETLAIKFFMTFETIFEQTQMRKTNITLPLVAINKIALICLDLIDNDAIRGGKQPFIIAVIVPQDVSQELQNKLMLKMEEHCQQFITIQSANLDTLISYSNQILKENPVTTDNARHDQSPITKSTSQTDSFYDEDIKAESQIELPAKPKMIKIKKKRNETPKFKNESLIVKELIPNGISSHKMEIVEDFVISPFVDGQQNTEAFQYMNMDIDTLNQMDELPDYGNGIGIEDEIGNGNGIGDEIAKDHVIEINNGIDEIGIDNEIEAWYELKRQKNARQEGSKLKKQNTIESKKETKIESKKETKIESIEGTRDHNSQNKINQITLAESELHKLNELINLSAPDFKNIGEVEKWFDAKRIMLQNLIPRFKK